MNSLDPRELRLTHWSHTREERIGLSSQLEETTVINAHTTHASRVLGDAANETHVVEITTHGHATDRLCATPVEWEQECSMYFWSTSACLCFVLERCTAA